MSAAPLSPDFIRAPEAPQVFSKPLRARRTGTRAALGMGGSACVILLAALIFGSARHDGGKLVAEAENAAPAAAQAEPKITKITAKADSAETLPLPIVNAKLPFSAFDLKTPQFEQEKKTIAVRDGEDGAGRIDTVTLGQFAMGAPYLRVDIHQQITEREADADFFLDMNRQASQAGLNVGKINPPAALATRLGAFEAADIRLTQPASEGVAASERSCLAARLVDAKASVVVKGLACGDDAKPIDRVAFGCMLERLSYAGDDSRLTELFAKAGGAACGNVSRDDITASIPAASHPARARPHRRGHR